MCRGVFKVMMLMLLSLCRCCCWCAVTASLLTSRVRVPLSEGAVMKQTRPCSRCPRIGSPNVVGYGSKQGHGIHLMSHVLADVAAVCCWSWNLVLYLCHVICHHGVGVGLCPYSRLNVGSFLHRSNTWAGGESLSLVQQQSGRSLHEGIAALRTCWIELTLLSHAWYDHTTPYPGASGVSEIGQEIRQLISLVEF